MKFMSCFTIITYSFPFLLNNKIEHSSIYWIFIIIVLLTIIYYFPGDQCPSGHYCIAGSSTYSPCDPGYYQPSVGGQNVTWCILCTAGKFCNSSGLSAPDGSCDAGRSLKSREQIKPKSNPQFIASWNYHSNDDFPLHLLLHHLAIFFLSYSYLFLLLFLILVMLAVVVLVFVLVVLVLLPIRLPK